MRKLIGILGLVMAVLLSACGGGGGSPGTTQEQYSITLRADKTSLPTNIMMVSPGGQGVDAPYTTTLYVNAKKGDSTIPGGEDIFECSIDAGKESGALYYLDGNPDHNIPNTDPPIPASYRAITLGANSGGATFHYHAWGQAGVARITCSVTDPRDGRLYSASVDIKVGSATGEPSSIQVVAQAPEYLGTQGNLWNLRTSIAIQAYVWDDSNQPVPNPSAPNLQVSILNTEAGAAGADARLLSGAASGNSIKVKTLNGVAQFALSSGPNAGPILLKMVTDRNLGNGKQDQVSQLYVIRAVPAVGQTPLEFPAPPNITVTNAEPMFFVLEASGGVLPYTWTALDPLPTGLSLDAQSGIIKGTPLTAAGAYVARVRVTDDAKASVTAPVTIVVQGLIKPALVISEATISATVGIPFSYALTASGGRPPLTWTAPAPLPAGLTLTSDGVLSGTLGTEGSYLIAVKVTDSDGTSANGNISVSAKAVAPSSP
jgi:hypothetical protein